MLILDLRLFGFTVLLVLVLVLWAGPLLRWLRQVAGYRTGLPEARDLEPALTKAPLGLLLLEGSQTCHYANDYARQVLGLPSPACRLPDVAWTYQMEADRALLRREGASSVRYRAISLSGESDGMATDNAPCSFVRWWITPVGDADLVFLLDVSAQQRAEEAARALLNDVSHELRTPLATILTHLEVLSLPALPPETSRQSIDLLRSEAKRMARLVHLMLELGRLETGVDLERRPLNALALVEETVAQMAQQAGERQVAISVEADSPLPLCLGDADRLRQVFLNLLDNAVKYCRPRDGVVVALTRRDGGVYCEVRDSGPGIPAADLPHVTRRFYRAAPQEAEGSGLGLALVAEIVRRHGGELNVVSDSEGDQTGTTIGFLLSEAFAARRRQANGLAVAAK